MTKPKGTGKGAATKASRDVTSTSGRSQECTAADSSLSQSNSPRLETSVAAASAAGRTLQDPHASRAAKSAAASALRTVRSSAKIGSVSRSAAKSAVRAIRINRVKQVDSQQP